MRGLPKLFGTSGIRGVFPDRVNPELMIRVGRAVASYFGRGPYAIGRDARTSSEALSLALASGLLASGSSVVGVGLVPIGVLAWSVRRLKLRGGVYVTASHNPPNYNGLKVFKEGGLEITSEDEVGLERAIEDSPYAEWTEVGRYSAAEVVEEYARELESLVRPAVVRHSPRVILDVANGPAGLVAPRVLADLGFPALTINGDIDGRFPGRYPEPRPDVLEPLVPLLRASGFEALLAFDGDGDRLSVVTPRRGFVKQDRVIALFAFYALKDRRGTVVVSVDCGNAVRQVVEGSGGRLVFHRLGKTHEGLVKYGDVVLTAEPWKIIDPRWGKWIDAVYQATYLVKLMAEEGRSLDELLEQVPDYPQARYSVAVPEELRVWVFEEVAEALRSRYSERARPTEIDGLRLDFEDGSWVLLRASGTEPKVRLYAEAPAVGRLRELVETVLGLVVRSLASRGVKPTSVEGAMLA